MVGVGADVVNYVRGAWTNAAPETATADEVSSAAKETHTLLAGTQSCPPLGAGPVADVLNDPSNGAQTVLQGTNEANLGQSATRIIALIHAKAPQAARADIVNQATDAYCPIVGADATLAPIDRWRQLTEFSQRLYTQLATGTRQ